MKKIFALFVFVILGNSVFADNFFQDTNPFPKTTPQSLNNIYEASPVVMQEEKKQEKKSWFRRGKTQKEQEIQDVQKRLYTYPPEAAKNDNAQDGSYYMFNN